MLPAIWDTFGIEIAFGSAACLFLACMINYCIGIPSEDSFFLWSLGFWICRRFLDCLDNLDRFFTWFPRIRKLSRKAVQIVQIIQNQAINPIPALKITIFIFLRPFVDER